AGGYVVARGTSFAAPLVAGLLAAALPAPDPALAPAALQRVAEQAIDLGAPGRDPVFGIGLVGESARVAPDRVQARAR
ncbi:MAG TPA: S8 family serine peptidase, partial [Burkholderiaceae bacterium]|nr:S8 family serine peptidase [Burkholderiaceae bacterium]